jgi:hypothetical protein
MELLFTRSTGDPYERWTVSKLTPHQILTSSNKYPERETSLECTVEVRNNAQLLCDRVLALLADLGWDKALTLTSGFRTKSSNDKTSNAGAMSRHLLGAACDILDDKDQTLAKLIQSREDLLVKHGLYTEHLSKTVGKYTNWVHLEITKKNILPMKLKLEAWITVFFSFLIAFIVKFILRGGR